MGGKMENKPRVLYVEDDKDIQTPIAEMLRLLGYNVECADNGKIAVEKVEQWTPDIIITDVRMPIMDGPTAIRILRSKPRTQNTPILVLSAYSDFKTRDECRQVGADAFFDKPVDIDRLNKAIKKRLKIIGA